MNFAAYWKVEVGRMLRSKMTWLVVALSLAAPLTGYTMFSFSGTITRAMQYLMQPVEGGEMGITLLFALLTLYELNRVHKYETAALTDTIVSPLVLSAARVMALLTVGVLSGLLRAGLYLPYTWIKMGHLFDLQDYLGMWLIVQMPCALFGTLLAAVCYQITRRSDLSLVIVLVCIFLGTHQAIRDNYILRWVSPIVPTMSDDFSNAQPIRMALYNRLFWMLILGGAWILSLLGTRRYGKGLLGSLARNARKAYIPAVAALLLVAGATAYAQQPYVNNSPPDTYSYDVDPTPGVTLRATHVDAVPNIGRGTQHGTATYRLSNENTAPVEQVLLINSGYTVQRMTINGEPLAFEDLRDDKKSSKGIAFLLPPGDDLELVVEYGGYPMLWKLVGAFMGGDEIERRYVYLTNTAFAPMYPATPADGIYHNTANITLPANLTPLILSGDVTRGDSDGETVTWRLQNDAPQATQSRSMNTFYLFAADYVVQDVSTEDMSTKFYYSRKHEDVMERLNIRETLQDVMRYCVDHYGQLPFSSGGDLKLLQVSSFLSGGYADDGMSVMYENSFSEDGLSDPLRGAGGNEVMAHEIIHQWWGLGRMFSDMMGMDMEPGWSSEGFTVFATYRLMKEKYGADYAQKYYVDVWQREVDAMNRNFYARHPEYLDSLPLESVYRIASTQDMTRQYCEMPLRILKAAELIGGEDAMDEVMRTLFADDDALEMPPFLSFQDFLNACGLEKEALL